MFFDDFYVQIIMIILFYNQYNVIWYDGALITEFSLEQKKMYTNLMLHVSIGLLGTYVDYGRGINSEK